MSKQLDDERMNPDRRQLLGAVALSAVAAGVSNWLPLQPAAAAADDGDPAVPHQLAGKRSRRSAAAHRRDEVAGSRENVADASQGVQLATMRDSRAIGRPITTGARSKRGSTPCRSSSPRSMGSTSISSTFAPNTTNALPVIVTHGWPGSVIEQLKIIDPLTNPTAHGGSASDAFDRRDPVAAGLRVFRQADRPRLGSHPHRARLDRADEAARLHAIRRARRRLGQCGHRADGAAGAAGIARHPHQHAGHRSRRRRKGAPRRAGAGRPLGRREACLRPARLLLQARPGLRSGDGEPSADAVCA